MGRLYFRGIMRPCVEVRAIDHKFYCIDISREVSEHRNTSWPRCLRTPWNFSRNHVYKYRYEGANKHYGWSLKSRSTGDNFYQLHCNSSLSCFVIDEGKFIIDFLGVFGCILHRVHSSRLLRSGIVKESNPQVGGKIQLVKGKVTCVFIWEGLVVKLGESHGFKESLLWHELHMSNNGLDGGLELVIDNSDLVWVVAHSRNMDSHGHNGWVVVWGSDLRDGGLQ